MLTRDGSVAEYERRQKRNYKRSSMKKQLRDRLRQKKKKVATNGEHTRIRRRSPARHETKSRAQAGEDMPRLCIELAGV